MFLRLWDIGLDEYANIPASIHISVPILLTMGTLLDGIDSVYSLESVLLIGMSYPFVLLDKNLLELIFDNPLFIREHSKKVLRSSVYNDTLFLSKLNVMDYSLLVGIDKESKELVIGIVDFIRTFTWDKKLESWVKETGLLGGGKEPTIVTPRQYKNRFREAMERYFLMVPDKFVMAGNIARDEEE